MDTLPPLPPLGRQLGQPPLCIDQDAPHGVHNLQRLRAVIARELTLGRHGRRQDGAEVCHEPTGESDAGVEQGLHDAHREGGRRRPSVRPEFRHSRGHRGIVGHAGEPAIGGR